MIKKQNTLTHTVLWKIPSQLNNPLFFPLFATIGTRLESRQSTHGALLVISMTLE